MQFLASLVYNLIARPLLVFPWPWTQRFSNWVGLWAFPPIAACILHVRADGNVLAVARRGTLDQWGLPGGKVEPGEDPRTTALRETFEEAKVILKGSLFEIYRDRDDDGNLVVTYYVEKVYGEPSQGDAGPVAYVPWKELVEGPFKRYNTGLYQSYKLINSLP